MMSWQAKLEELARFISISNSSSKRVASIQFFFILGRTRTQSLKVLIVSFEANFR